MTTKGEDGIFKKAVGDVKNSSPGWWAFCGGLGLLSITLAISFRIMDFNPGPLWEKHYEVLIESGKLDNQIKRQMLENRSGSFKQLEERLEKVEQMAHEAQQ